jgi:hypothetical protein
MIQGLGSAGGRWAYNAPMNEIILLLAIIGLGACGLLAADYGLLGAQARELARRIRAWWSL